MLKLPFQKLKIWEKAIVLAKKIYLITRRFPRSEMYGIVSQLQRSAVSVPSNIAEGSQRGSNKEFKHFVSIARGSLAELETQIILSHEIGYIAKEEYQEIIASIHEVARMMNSFSRQLTTIH